MNTGTKADVEKAISKIPGSKTIVVHPELYKRLLIEKGTMMIAWADPNKRPFDQSAPAPTFANVIAEALNNAEHFGQLISRIIREHPELKPIIEEVAKQDPELYRLVEPMLSVLGKPKSR